MISHIQKTKISILVPFLCFFSPISTAENLTGIPLSFNNQQTAILLYSIIKLAKKGADAHELDDLYSELRRAEKGAFAYGVINIITNYLEHQPLQLSPFDAATDATGYVATYWVVRKAYKAIIETPIALAVKEYLSLDRVPEKYTDACKQIFIGLVSHLIYTWSKQMDGTLAPLTI